jgi:hypothetical protein
MIPVKPSMEGVSFDLALTAAIGAMELKKMDRALGHRTDYWGANRGQ